MKRFLSLVLALIMTASLVTISAGAEFADVKDITYVEAVEVMTAIDVIDGYADGSFGPATNLTRGAAAKIICNLILGPTTAGALRADAAPYADVAADHVFAPYIAYLAKEGIVSGYADGSFKPAAPLTGYAFMKMLLGVAGYDAEMEGYTGANWSINVAKQGLAIELLEGYEGTFNGTATVNRETAMLMAFNTIQADNVGYGEKTAIQVGDITITSKTEAYKTGGKVMDKYFEDLDLRVVTDAFGRPANNWFNDKEEIGLYSKKADATYTAKTDVKTIYGDLGLSDDLANLYFWEDGVVNFKGDHDDNDQTADTWVKAPAFTKLTKKGTSTIGAAGTLVEVFYDKDLARADIVVVNTYVDEIYKVNVDSSVDERTVSIVAGDFETELFDVEDIVLYTIDKSTNEIQSMAKAEKVEGVDLTKYVDKNVNGVADEFVAAGKTYTVAAQYDASETSLTGVGDVLDLYMDAYGNVIFATATASAKKYAYVLDAGSDGGRYAGEITYFAKVLTTEGKVEELEVGKVGAADATAANTAALKGGIVKYALNGDGNYTLTAQTGVTKYNTMEIKNGVSAIDGTAFYGSAKTVYLVETGDDNNPTYTAYVGYRAVPSLKATNKANVITAWSEGGTTIASIVFVANDANIAGGSSYIYLDGTSISGKITDANNETGYYVVPAIVDGEIKTLYVDAQIGADKMMNTLVTFDDGVVDWGTTDNAAYYYETSKTEDAWYAQGVVTEKLKDGVIMIGGVAYNVADDVAAFLVTDNSDPAINAADTIAVTSVKSIQPGTAVDYIVEDGAVTVIIATEVTQPV